MSEKRLDFWSMGLIVLAVFLMVLAVFLTGANADNVKMPEGYTLVCNSQGIFTWQDEAGYTSMYVYKTERAAIKAARSYDAWRILRAASKETVQGIDGHPGLKPCEEEE